MRYLIPLLIVASAYFSSCNKKEKVKAKIFERKQINKNRLAIKYEYTLDNKTYIDSATVKNVIIANDSINIILNSPEPGKSFPDLEK